MMQKGFERNPKRAPKYWQNTLQLGKVIRVDAAAKTVDISMINGGAVHLAVPVLAPMVSTSSGISHLPDPENPKTNQEQEYDAPIAYGGRDIFAIVGFVSGIGTMPIVLGFRYPEENQLSFSNEVGANHHIDRHESDRYHRITGDTVKANGGKDVSGEEEVRYPDNSYMKVVKAGGSRSLTNLSQLNRDKDTQPFIVKKEDRKGFYFQHASGTRVWIGHDGEVKICHHTGSWFSIAPDTGELTAESVSIGSVDSETDPPEAASSSPVQIHLCHSSGTSITIDASGNITITGVGTQTEVLTGNKTVTAPAFSVVSPAVSLGSGTPLPLLDSRTHTYLVDLITALNTWLNNHTHTEQGDGNPTSKPDQTANLASPPAIGMVATTNTVAS